MATVTIKSILKKGADRHTLAGSLAEHGYTRQPGTGITIPPYRERDGKFRTGLDPDALYIKSLPVEEQEIERTRVSTLRKQLEERSGLDLGPRSDYYTKLTDEEMGTLTRAEMVRLTDGEKVFNDEDVQAAITSAWLRVHPLVASSYEKWRSGQSGPLVLFYVSDEEIETKISYDNNMAVAIINSKILEMTPTNRKRLARLLDIPVSDDSKEEYVFNKLNETLMNKSGEITFGGYKGRQVVLVFNELMAMKEENLNLKDLVKQSIQHGIYRRNKGAIMDGTTKIADSEAELVASLTTNTEDRIALESKLKTKKKLTAA